MGSIDVSKFSDGPKTSNCGLVGLPNESVVFIDEVHCVCLIDTGSMVTTVSQEFLKSHLPSLPVFPVGDILTIKGPMDEELPYSGFVELEISIPFGKGNHSVGVFPVLVSPNTPYNHKVPVLLGTNVLNCFFSQIVEKVGDSYLQSVQCQSLRTALQALSLRERHLKKSQGVYGLMRTVSDVSIEGKGNVIVEAQPQIVVPGLKTVALVETSNDQFNGHTLTPILLSMNGTQSSAVYVELCNNSSIKIDIPANTAIGRVCQVTLPDEIVPGVEGNSCLEQFNIDELKSLVSVDEIAELRQILLRQRTAFSLGSLDLGCTSVVKHQINLSDNLPFKERARRIPPALFEEVREHLKEMLACGVIRESSSPWASNVVLVRKKDGSLRFCLDFRKLNSRTIKDAYALPRIEDTLDALNGACWFSTLDLKSGYWQVEVEERDKPKTAFTVGPLGFFECNRLPFGLTNSPATFQRLMQKIMGDLHLRSCLIYLDDIIIFSKTVQEHFSRLEEVLIRLKEAGLKLKPSKCLFLHKRLKYLGHVVSESGIECDPDRCREIQQWKVPSCVREVQQFLGLAGFYRKHVKDFAKIAKPLHYLTGSVKNKNGVRKSVPWEWGESQQSAFERLIHALTTPPVLAYPDYSKPFVVHVDASYEGLGAVLGQDQDGGFRVVSYASRALRKSEQNYPSNKLEFLALRWAVTTKFHDYLYGHKFVVMTDNNPLTYVLTTAKLDAVGHRWLAELASYDFQIRYKSGRSNVDADVLSRIPRQIQCSSSTLTQVVTESCSDQFSGYVCTLSADSSVSSDFVAPSLPVLKGLDIDWLSEQKKDPILGKLVDSLESGVKPDMQAQPVHFRPYLKVWKKLCLENGILYHKGKSDQGAMRLVLPSEWRGEAFKLLHSEMGHLGRDRTLALLKDRFYWPGMSDFVQQKIRSCDRCLRAKAPHLPHRATLNPIQTSQPLELLCLDFLSLEVSKGGYDSILVITDHFTKYSQAFPTRNQTAVTTARVLFDNFLVHYGFPQRILTDQGKNFEGHLIKQLCRLAGVRKCRTTPYHPMGNGNCERFNQTLLAMLRTLSEDQKSNWKAHVPSLVHAYNSTVHDSTGFSPFYLMFGREPRLPVDVLFGLDQPKGIVSETKFVSNLCKQLECAYGLVCDRQGKASKRHKRNFDLKARGSVPKVGDRVLVKNVGLRGKHKIADRWEQDVYVIKDMPDPNLPVYAIQKEGSNSKPRHVHRNLLLPLALPCSIPVVSSSSQVDEVGSHPKDPVRDQDSSSDEEQFEISIPVHHSIELSESSESTSSNTRPQVTSSPSNSESDSSSVGSVASEPSVQASPEQRLGRGCRRRAPPTWLQSGDFYTYLQRHAPKVHPEGHSNMFLDMYLSLLDHHKLMMKRMFSCFKS